MCCRPAGPLQRSAGHTCNHSPASANARVLLAALPDSYIPDGVADGFSSFRSKHVIAHTVSAGDVADSVVFQVDPIVITGAFEDVNFTLPAPGVIDPKYVTGPPGFNITVVNFTQPPDDCARVNVTSAGALTLQPKESFSGNCSFMFSVRDVTNTTLQANVTVVIGERYHKLGWGVWIRSGTMT